MRLNFPPVVLAICEDAAEDFDELLPEILKPAVWAILIPMHIT